ncbi:hypothetical protein [Streptomyces sp. NPDC057545]|uniref:hypothetical protein n=1 Tax=Streptomyces sp. NPDC057545 TaxID=3346164 RepID=UPI0036CB5604
MTTDTLATGLPPVSHRFASDDGGRDIFGRRLEMALTAAYGERGQWPWGMLAAARLLTELRRRVDDQAVFVPLLDRLRDGVPVGRLSSKAATMEDVADQLAKSIRVMLDAPEAGEILSEAADYAYAAVLRFRTWCEGERAAFLQRHRTPPGRRAAAARTRPVEPGPREDFSAWPTLAACVDARQKPQ